MPIYEYECKDCGKKFEEIVFGGETPECPACHSANTEKMMSRCCHFGARSGNDAASAAPSAGGGCSGCSGGNCACCGH